MHNSVVESSCYCGTTATARCPRCGEARCSAHHVLNVWWDDRAQRWAAEKPSGSQWQDWLHDVDPEQKGILTPNHLYARSYAEGGPGCQKCRADSADRAVAEAHSAVTRFVKHGAIADLQTAANGADVLSEAEVAELARAASSYAREKIDLATVNVSTPRKKRWQLGPQDSAIVRVEEISRRPLGWFSSCNVAVDPNGMFFRAGQSRKIVQRETRGLAVLVATGTDVTVAYTPDDPRGSDSAPGNDVFGTLTSGILPVPVRRDRAGGESRYTYLEGVLRPTLRDVAAASVTSGHRSAS